MAAPFTRCAGEFRLRGKTPSAMHGSHSVPGEAGQQESASSTDEHSAMNMKRMRGRNHRGGGGGGGPVRHQSGNTPMNRNHVFDSQGPDLRIRGTAQQLSEKYLQLGRDATSSGDRVMAESYFQYAEHYFRILGAMNQVSQQNQGGGQHGHRRNEAPEAESAATEEPFAEAQVVESRQIPITAVAPEEAAAE